MEDQLLVASMRKILSLLYIKLNIPSEPDITIMCDTLIKMNDNELRGFALANFRQVRNDLIHRLEIKNKEAICMAISILKTWYLTLCSRESDFNTETELLVFDLLIYSLNISVKGNALENKVAPMIETPAIFEYNGSLNKLMNIVRISDYKIYLMAGRNATKVCRFVRREKNCLILIELHTNEYLSTAVDVKVGILRHYSSELIYKGTEFVPTKIIDEGTEFVPNKIIDELNIEQDSKSDSDEQEGNESNKVNVLSIVKMNQDIITNVLLPEFSNITLKELRDDPIWKEKIKGRKIKILQGKHADSDACFLYWNGTVVNLQLCGTSIRICAGITKTVAVYATREELLL